MSAKGRLLNGGFQEADMGKLPSGHPTKIVSAVGETGRPAGHSGNDCKVPKPDAHEKLRTVRLNVAVGGIADAKVV